MFAPELIRKKTKPYWYISQTLQSIPMFMSGINKGQRANDLPKINVLSEPVIEFTSDF